MAETTVNLDQFETKAVFELESRAASTYLRQLMIRGNALLSSVYIKSASAGATLKVNYFDTTSGDTNTGERYDLLSHSLLTDANVGDTVRLLIPRIHNKPQVEAIVTGTVEFGLYVTVVADFPVDLQGALDGQTADLGADDGLPISTYDPSDGKFYLLRSSGGVLSTGSALSDPTMHTATIALANIEQSFVFPAGTRRFLIKPRGVGKILLKHAPGGNYMTIWAGAFYCSPEFAAEAKTIYFQSPVAGLEVELESWS